MNDLRTLCALFDKYAHAENHATAFERLLDAFLLPFHLFEEKEDREKQIQGVTKLQKIAGLGEALQMIGTLSEGFGDPLGDLYMEKVSKGHNGQYFTPQYVCDLMAAITIESIEEKKTVYDPACGSGRMLLAAGKMNRELLFCGADLDKICCKITVANMLLQSLSGEIVHMDSLNNQFYTGYYLGTTLFGRFYYPWFQEFTFPEMSRIWMHPPMRTGKPSSEKFVSLALGASTQGTLF